MGPIEYFYIAIQVVIMLVGVARGYAKELGNTLIFMVAIFLLSYFGEQAETIVKVTGERVFSIAPDSDAMRTFLMVTFTVAFGMMVFASYAGRTLEFPGKPIDPPGGFLLNVLIGLLNGYLVAGTLWYYMNKFAYPGGAVTQPLSSTAQLMIDYLPQTIFPSPVAWMVPVAILLLMRVRG